MNFIDRALAQGEDLTPDEFLQAMADIYKQPQVWQELDRYPQYIQDVISIIDYDTEVQMEGLDAFVTGPHVEQYEQTRQALRRCGADSEAEILERAKALADTEADCGEDSFDEDAFDTEMNALCGQIALYQDYEGFWNLVRAYIETSRAQESR